MIEEWEGGRRMRVCEKVDVGVDGVVGWCGRTGICLRGKVGRNGNEFGDVWWLRMGLWRGREVWEGS